VLCIDYVMRLLVYFFFSSRRRHTRFSRDWSSDVCSSDLPLKHLWTTAAFRISVLCLTKNAVCHCFLSTLTVRRAKDLKAGLKNMSSASVIAGSQVRKLNVSTIRS